MATAVKLGNTSKPATVSIGGGAKTTTTPVKAAAAPAPAPKAAAPTPAPAPKVTYTPTPATPAVQKAAAATSTPISPSPTPTQTATIIQSTLSAAAAKTNAAQVSLTNQINNMVAASNLAVQGNTKLTIQSTPVAQPIYGQPSPGTENQPTIPGLVTITSPKTATGTPEAKPVYGQPTAGTTSTAAVPTVGAPIGYTSGGEGTTVQKAVPLVATTGQQASSTPWVYVGTAIPATGNKSLAQTLKDSLAAATRTVSSAVKTVQKAFSGDSDWTYMSIMDIPTPVSSGVTQYIDLTKEVLGQAITSAGEYGDAAVEGCTGPLCDIAGSLTGGIEGLLSGAIGTIEGIIATLSGFVSTIATAVTSLATSAATAVESIVTTIKEIPGLIETAITNIYNRIETTINQIPDWIKGAYDWAVEKIDGLVTTISDGFQSMYEWAFGKVSEIVTPIIDQVKEAVQPAIDAAANAWSKVEGLWSWLTSAWQNVENIVSEVIKQGQDLWNYITTIDWTQAISEAIGSLISWLASVLEPILARWLPTEEEIKKKLGEAMGALSELGDDALRDWCSDPLSVGE